MTVEPLVLTVRRYQCPFCHRSRSAKQTTIEHIGRCWRNPANRSCKTCGNYNANYSPPCDARPGCGCQDSEPYCEARAPQFELALTPVTDCPLWQLKDGAE